MIVNNKELFYFDKIKNKMQSYKLKIPSIGKKDDLTIIYKEMTEGKGKKGNLYELKVSKNDLFKALGYFDKKSNEIKQMKFIYIEENIDFELFDKFIKSINTQEIDIDEQNYEEYYYLSDKYEYDDLREQIIEFIEKRPDIDNIINQMINKTSKTRHEDGDKSKNRDENENDDEYDPDKEYYDKEKEELISKNIDVSIKNGLLQKLPINMIIRILESPKINIKDHHLFFRFIISILKTQNKDNDDNDKDDYNEFKEYLSILPSFLDYLKMDRSEIEELFSTINEIHIFQPRNSDKLIQKLITEEKTFEDKYLKLEERIESIEKQQRAQKVFQEEEQKNNKKEIINITTMIDERTRELNDRLCTIEAKEEQRSKEIMTQYSRIFKNEEQVEKQHSTNINNDKIIQKQNLRITSNEEMIKELMKSINDIKELIKNADNSKVINEPKQQEEKECPNGIFQYLFDEYKTNPIEIGLMSISGNSINQCNQQKLLYIIDPQWMDDWWVSKYVENSYIKIDFVQFSVKINKYSFRTGNSNGYHLLKSWKLIGITEDFEEILLDEVNNSQEITQNHQKTTRNIQNDSYIKSVKLKMKGKNSSEYLCILMQNIEFFGFIKT